jgi:hypothetical protein
MFMGDVADFQAISFHANNPNCPGVTDEYLLAKQCIQRWRRAFPKAKVCIGNHDERVIRLAESVNIPTKFLRDFSEIWKTSGWEWDYDFIIDNVYYFHGTGNGGTHPAWNVMSKQLMSVVMGHLHSRAGIKWKVNPQKRIFGMDVGCVDKDTEYLSPEGWVSISNYKNDTDVAQYNGDGTISFIKPSKYIVAKADYLNHFETKYGVSQTLCDNHNVIYINRSGKLCSTKALDVFKQHKRDSNGFRGKFITSFEPTSEGTVIPLTDDELKLQVAFIADGTLGDGFPRIVLRKKRKKKALKELLYKTSVTFKESTYKNGDTSFWFKPPLSVKEFPLDWYYKASVHQLELIANESLLWDGDQKNRFYSMSKVNADFIQYAFAGSNRRASISQDKDECYKVIVSQTTNLVGIASTDKCEIKKVKAVDGYKYCFEVPSHMLVLRKDGCIFVTGNCGIDVKAYQFAYGRHCKEKPVLACGVVIDGIPYHEIMPASDGEKYCKENFEGK